MKAEEVLQRLADKYNLTHVKEILISAQEQAHSNVIDVAILGQFKAGKSSLINSLLGKDVLPTGVIPVTAIITRIYYSATVSVTINFLDGSHKQVTLDELIKYITEAQNPQNQKNVESADIGLPEMKWLEGIRLIDTPGLGSIFQNNTQTTRQWSARTTIALIVISAERPLSEEDMKLLQEIKHYSYKTYCIITKVDLFSAEQITQIKDFVSQGLYKALNSQIPVLLYSTKKDTEKYKQELFSAVLRPLQNDTTQELRKIYKYKLLRSALLLQNYLTIAHEASIKTEKEQRLLHDKIFNSQTSANYLYQQVQLIASDIKSQVRGQLEQLLLPHLKEITTKIQSAFDQEYKTWTGNLYKISRKYESWLKRNLCNYILKVVKAHRNEMLNIITEARNRFSSFTDTFTENLRRKIFQNLGIEIKTLEWQAQLRPFHTPDISVYRAFDSNIDLLWFLFPMIIFKNFFGRHLHKQIPQEVQKNIYRTISVLTGMINKEIENLAQQTILYINQYIDTITKALTVQQQKIQELQSDLRATEQVFGLIK